MPNIKIGGNGYYTVDNLYQWDLNQDLHIYGLNIPVPVLHFTNTDMGASINRYGSVNKLGVISVKIPNSMLQKNTPVIVYICSYEGDAFKTHYKLEIPVKARTKPGDYTLEVDDEEVYSFNELEQFIVKSINDFDAKLEQSLKDYDTKYYSKYNDIATQMNQNNQKVSENTSIVNEYTEKFIALNNHVGEYDNLIDEAKHYKEPWNVDENVVSITSNPGSAEIKSYASNSGNTPTGLVTKMLDQVMINSGTILLKFNYEFKSTSSGDYSDDTTYIKIYMNDKLLDTIVREDTSTHEYEAKLIVSKDDILKIELSAKCVGTSSGNNVTTKISNCDLYANIETPYRYNTLFGTYTEVTTDEILNALLGV